MKLAPLLPLFAAAALCLSPGSARAQATAVSDTASAQQTAAPDVAAQSLPAKIYVASYGNDANNGSRANPKRNLQAAHNAAATNGEVVVLDTGSYGALQITKSLAVTVAPGVNAFVAVTGTNNAITVAAGAGSVVSLRGLIIEGGGSRQSSGNGPGFGIYVTSVGWLTVEDCTIRNFLDALPFLPTTSNAHLTVYNTTVRDCRYGVDVQALASAGSSPIAVISGCRLENLGDAIYASGPEIAFVSLENTAVSNCSAAIHFELRASVFVSNCTFAFCTLTAGVNPDSNGIYFVSSGNNSRHLAGGASPFPVTQPAD